MRTQRIETRLHVALSLVLGGYFLSAGACQGKTGALSKDAPQGAQERIQKGGRTAVHPPAPPLDLAILGGGDFKLEQARGEVLLLNVWATWCKPCRKELPELARLHRELGPRGFSVVGVSVDPARKKDEVAQMVRELDLPFPVLLDPDNVSVHDWSITGYPTSFVIDKAGGVRWRREGIIYEHDEELAATINASIESSEGAAQGRDAQVGSKPN